MKYSICYWLLFSVVSLLLHNTTKDIAFARIIPTERPPYRNERDDVIEAKLKHFEEEFGHDLRGRLNYDSYDFGVSCRTCRVFLEVVRKFWKGGEMSEYIAVQFTIKICSALGIQRYEVCSGVAREYRSELSFVMRDSNLSTSTVCSALLAKDCGSEIFEKPWKIPLPPAKPPITKIKPHQPGSSVFKVLHLTDLHIDLQYKEKTSTDCGEPICCRKANGPGTAGYWGSYGCDIPMRTFENALQHIKKNHNDISHILLTGDIPPHNVWQDSKKSQIDVMRKALRTLSEYFPNKKVFVTSGNHDTHPTNSFPPPSLYKRHSIQWLLDAYADLWSPWLPESALATIRKGGFYTALVSKGFRIISINTNYCNMMNWWLLPNTTDPVGQLQWLVDVLQEAEDKGEKVHIIGHIPSGERLCFKYWSSNYYKIINRFESTVAAQFSGHTHRDHFEIFYDLQNKTRPISLWYIAPSLTTSDKYQPSYRIYEIDGDNSSRVVLDHKTFVLDLESSNKKKGAIWKLQYSAKDAYNMTSLHPEDWDELVRRMEYDEKLFQKFYRFKYHYPLKEPCDEKCKRKEICALKTATSYDNSRCFAERVKV